MLERTSLILPIVDDGVLGHGHEDSHRLPALVAFHTDEGTRFSSLNRVVTTIKCTGAFLLTSIL